MLTDETRHLIGEKALRGMKPTAILINTARGELVDEAAVARAVEERWIAAAAVDAFAQEPLPAQHPYRTVDPERLILTPHNSATARPGAAPTWRWPSSRSSRWGAASRPPT